MYMLSRVSYFSFAFIIFLFFCVQIFVQVQAPLSVKAEGGGEIACSMKDVSEDDKIPLVPLHPMRLTPQARWQGCHGEGGRGQASHLHLSEQVDQHPLHLHLHPFQLLEYQMY